MSIAAMNHYVKYIISDSNCTSVSFKLLDECVTPVSVV